VPCRAVPCRAVPCRAVPCRAVSSYYILHNYSIAHFWRFVKLKFTFFVKNFYKTPPRLLFVRTRLIPNYQSFVDLFVVAAFECAFCVSQNSVVFCGFDRLIVTTEPPLNILSVKESLNTIALSNQKGGVGKTSTTLNLGAGLAREGKRV